MNSFSKDHASLGERIARRWREWRARRADQAALSGFDAQERERIAHDMGLDGAELRALAAQRGDAADLLPRRMGALGLDPTETARQEPAVLRDMQRLCSFCQSKGRCEHDLDLAARNPVWEKYCPNVGTLKDLQAEKRADDIR
jgi:hypothetical protein